MEGYYYLHINGGLIFKKYMPESDSDIEELIKTICRREGITVERLRERGYTAPVPRMRQEIARILNGRGMSKREIGLLYSVIKYLG